MANGGKWWQMVANGGKIVANGGQMVSKWWQMVANNGK